MASIHIALFVAELLRLKDYKQWIHFKVPKENAMDVSKFCEYAFNV